MKSILVIGGGGYLGARLCSHLAKKGYSVKIFDKSVPNENVNWHELMDEIVIGDVRNVDCIENLAQKHIDAVIQLVSLDHHKSEAPPGIISTVNVLPTWNLLEIFTKNGLKKFINFSTQHVLGSLTKGLIKESYTPQPNSKYALTHFIREQIVNYYHYKTGTDCINVRISNGYGSPVFSGNNCWWLVVNNLCLNAYHEQHIKLHSDGSPVRDFIHVSDISQATERILEDSTNNLNLYHIASGSTTTILNVAKLVQRVYQERYGKKIRVVTKGAEPSALDEIERMQIDTSRIKSIGYRAGTSLELGINEIFDYLEFIDE